VEQREPLGKRRGHAFRQGRRGVHLVHHNGPDAMPCLLQLPREEERIGDAVRPRAGDKQEQ
jgi:hypothetical protein